MNMTRQDFIDSHLRELPNWQHINIAREVYEANSGETGFFYTDSAFLDRYLEGFYQGIRFAQSNSR